MKYTDLTFNSWYEGISNYNGVRWLFRFKSTNGTLMWCDKTTTPIDGYISTSSGTLDVKDIQPADMEEVFKFFPEEREIFKNIIYEIY